MSELELILGYEFSKSKRRVWSKLDFHEYKADSPLSGAEMFLRASTILVLGNQCEDHTHLNQLVARGMSEYRTRRPLGRIKPGLEGGSKGLESPAPEAGRGRFHPADRWTIQQYAHTLQHLQGIRTLLGLRGDELAAATGLRATTLARWEQKETSPSIFALRLLARGLYDLGYRPPVADSSYPVAHLMRLISRLQPTAHNARQIGVRLDTLKAWLANLSTPTLKTLLLIDRRLRAKDSALESLQWVA